MPSWRSLLAWVAGSFALVACEPPLAEQADDYAACDRASHERYCRSGHTQCRWAIFGGTGEVDSFCTTTCVEDRDCPAPSGVAGVAVCERFIYGAYCVLRCRRDEDCAAGTTCGAHRRYDDREVSICQAP